MKKIVVAAAVVVAVAAAAAFALVHRVHAAEAAWAESFGPIDGVPAKYRTAGNASAEMLSDWSARVAPTGRAQSVVFDYLSHEVESPKSAADANAFVQHFHAADVDEFATWVVAHPPVLAYEFRTPDAAIPNLLPILRLQKTLIAAAIARAAAGDRESAERLLDASWSFNESFRRGPTLIGQLIAQAIFRYQLGALRKIDVDAAKWLPRIRSVDFLTAVNRTLEPVTWYTDFSVHQNLYAQEPHLRLQRQLASAAGQPAPFPRWLAILRTPIRWFDLPSVLEGNRQMMLALPSLPRSEHIDSALHAAWTRGAQTWWSLPDPDVRREDWSSAYRRTIRTLAEQELTEKVLAARATKTIDSSSSIAGAKWVYEVAPDGRATIRLNRNIDWGNLIGLNVPLQYELH